MRLDEHAPGATGSMTARARTGFPVSVESLASQLALTRAEAEVVRGLCQGLSPEAIAASRSVSVTTVRTQLQRAMSKTGVRSLAALVARALRPFL